MQIIRAFATESGKRKAFAEIQARKGEGVVFKLRDSVYVAGRPNSNGPQVKFKFTASATCAVLSQNGSRRSAVRGIRNGNSELWVPIGNVTIPANFPIPPVGALVEVRYLYAYPRGALYQPVYLGPRTDQTLPDDVSTLKVQAGNGRRRVGLTRHCRMFATAATVIQALIEEAMRNATVARGRVVGVLCTVSSKPEQCYPQINTNAESCGAVRRCASPRLLYRSTEESSHVVRQHEKPTGKHRPGVERRRDRM